MSKILTNNTEIILASGSPRRRAFFQDLGLSFRIETANIVECPRENELPQDYTLRLACEKAEAVAKIYPEHWIVAADTVVCCDDQILEKPKNSADAMRMLMLLRNREHIVRSAVCLLCAKRSVTELCSVATIVTFWDFSEEVALRYVETKEPLDKAGAYGIQGKGVFLVRKINGSYSNVVGMPLAECIEMLARCGLVRA
ncbi:MAG: septum formation protein Maf [Desulfocapsa sp.]|nr:MAG: septum formation protein Maf [Desulfocapsa sp.]